MSPLEVIAVIFGLLCVGFSVRQSIWTWPTGLVQVSLYVVIFYQAKLYSDVILHVIYVGVQFFGWYQWLHGGKDHGRLPVSELSGRARGGWITTAILGSAAWGSGMSSLTDAALPYGDAFTTVASLIAQWLMAKKKIENWLFWIVVDVVAVGIYTVKELYLTAGLYGVFLVMCVLGYRAWKRDLA